MDRRLEVRALDETAGAAARAGQGGARRLLPAARRFRRRHLREPQSARLLAGVQIQSHLGRRVQVVWTPNDTLSAAAPAATPRRAPQTEMQKQLLRDSVKFEVMQAYTCCARPRLPCGRTRRGSRRRKRLTGCAASFSSMDAATSVERTDSEVELFAPARGDQRSRQLPRSARASLIHAVGRDIPAGALAK